MGLTSNGACQGWGSLRMGSSGIRFARIGLAGAGVTEAGVTKGGATTMMRWGWGWVSEFNPNFGLINHPSF